MISARMKAAMAPHCKAAGITPTDPRPEGQRIVALWPRTGVCRLFDKLYSVGQWYSASTYDASVFVNARQMSLRMTNSTMLRCLLAIDVSAAAQAEADALSGMALAEVLWNACQRNGSLVSREYPNATRESEQTNKYAIDLAKLSSPEGKMELAKQPRQCRVVAEALVMENQPVLSDEEMDSVARRAHTGGRLKTKQDPCRIFRYYLPQLGEMGFVEYRSRRVADDKDGSDGVDPDAIWGN